MGQRLFLGAVVAGSLSLVAFEWRSTDIRERPSDPFEDDRITLEPQLIVTVAAPPTKAPEPLVRTLGLNPVATPQPTADPAPDPGPDMDDPVVDPGPAPDPSPTASEGPFEPPTGYVPGRSIKPHFEQCLLEDPEAVDPCTEERILAHLQRKFRMPTSVSGKVRTTVTFSVEVDGTIGRVVCAPRVDPEVAREVERVLRSMPRFIPGSQGGVAVPVYYQIPLSLMVS